MPSSLRLPSPPEFRGDKVEDMVRFCKAMEDWARDLVHTMQSALDRLPAQGGTGWTVANPTISRTVDSAADALATLRNQFGTLINDLKHGREIG